LGLLVGPDQLYSQEEEVPGLFSSLNQLIKIHKKASKSQLRKLKDESLPFPLEESKDIRLDPFFLQSLLFYSDEKYFTLLNNFPCDLYALLENNLLRSSQGIIENVVVSVLSAQNKPYTVLLTKKKFLNFIYGKQCIDNKELSSLFNRKNIKVALKEANLKNPKSYKNCLETFQAHLKSTSTPYLCKIPLSIRLGKKAEKSFPYVPPENTKLKNLLSTQIFNKSFYQKNISEFQLNYLEGLCNNLKDAEKFCSFFKANDAWSKVLSGENPSYFLNYRCKTLLKIGKNPSKAQLKKCAERFIKNPTLCLSNIDDDKTHAFPLQRCDTLSRLLNRSKLKTDYQDCPGVIENQMVTNIFRISAHFAESETSLKMAKKCSSTVNTTFANLFLQSGSKDNWPLKVCYNDIATDEKTCLPYVPSKKHDFELSEGIVISQILQKTHGILPSEKCLVVDQKDFNPVLLKYRNGCFIVRDENCSSIKCARKIIYKKKIIKGIQYEGTPSFYYFPSASTDIANDSKSVAMMMKSEKKLRYKKLRNLPEILAFFQTSKKVLAHGIGCAGDILPQYFKKRSFNECIPLPFIIDGYYKDHKKRTYLITRLSIDDLHSPRPINWNKIYSAVKNYSFFHSMNSWLLYGIKN
jgi:hypothetical protein